MSNKNTILDSIQEKLLSWFTRPTLLVLILVITGLLAYNMVYFGWSITPSNKRSVSEKATPSSVQVSADDVKKAIENDKPKPVQKQVEKPAQDIVQAPIIDELEVALNKVMDSLKVLLPDSIYSWESEKEYDYYYGWKIKEFGVLDQLKAIKNNSDDKKHFIAGLNGLCGVLVQFDLKERKIPLEKYIQVWNEKSSARESLISENANWFRSERNNAENEYEETIDAKRKGERESFQIINDVLYPISLLAIFLVLLSIRKSLVKND